MYGYINLGLMDSAFQAVLEEGIRSKLDKLNAQDIVGLVQAIGRSPTVNVPLMLQCVKQLPSFTENPLTLNEINEINEINSATDTDKSKKKKKKKKKKYSALI
eukprot:Platyproteum_vivax@DN12378_c0_g1_i1.p1